MAAAHPGKREWRWGISVHIRQLASLVHNGKNFFQEAFRSVVQGRKRFYKRNGQP